MSLKHQDNDWTGAWGDAEDDADDVFCDRCGGAGFYHDCGEDTCCCDDPETDDLVDCPDCCGKGVKR